MSVFIPSSGGGAATYFEYAWVCAPNAAGQSITANTLTTLTLDTEVSDSSGTGSIASNQVTLPAGTYYFTAHAPILETAGAGIGVILSLYNVTDASIISRVGCVHNGATATPIPQSLVGQFTIAGSKAFELRAVTGAGTIVVRSGAYNAAFTLATASLDQRTTLRLWKVA